MDKMNNVCFIVRIMNTHYMCDDEWSYFRCYKHIIINKYICYLESLLVLKNFFFFVSLNNMLWKFIGKFVTFPRMSIRIEA